MRKLRLAKIYGHDAGVFISAVIQYLVKEVFKVSGYACEMHRVTKRMIIPRHLQVAFYGDEEIFKLVSNLLYTELKMPRIQALLRRRRWNFN